MFTATADELVNRHGWFGNDSNDTFSVLQSNKNRRGNQDRGDDFSSQMSFIEAERLW
jgi:hypothetical protein